MPKDKNKEEPHVRCDACDFQKLKKLESSPTVRELRDKVEQLNFKLMECKTENQMLKRSIQMAKQMVYKEVGDSDMDMQEMMRHGPDEGRRRRMENVAALKKKVGELQFYLNELEGNSQQTKISSTEECVKEQLVTDRKAFWKMELERRIAKETAEKDLDPILKELSELRKLLQTEKRRFRELNDEVNFFRLELQSQVDKNEQDMGLTKSFQTVESQLQETILERAEIRLELVGARARNKRLEDEVRTLKNELEVLSNKAKDNNMLIDTYTNKHKQLQDAIEAEKVIVQQKLDLYKTDLNKLKDNYHDDLSILNSFQNISYLRHQVIVDLQKDIGSGFFQDYSENIDKQDTLASSNQSAQTSDAGSSTKTDTTTSSKSSKLKAGVADKEKADAEKANEIKLRKKLKMFLEWIKYKTLFESAQIEREQLYYITQLQEKEMNEVAMQVVETGRLLIQKNYQKNAILERISRLQKRNKKANTDMVLKNDLEELRIKTEAQKEENDFLRIFLHSVINTRGRDFEVYKNFLNDTKVFFLDALQESINSFNEKKESFAIKPNENNNIQASVN